MTRSRSPSQGGAGGFTLLEVLIAMALLGLVFAVIASGLRFGTTAWRKADAVAATIDDLQVAHRVLSRQLSAAIPLEREARGGGDKRQVFDGTPSGVRFVGPAPARAMPEGLYDYRIEAEPAQGGVALLLHWSRHGVDPDADTEAAGASGTETIVAGLGGVEMSYFGDPLGRDAPRWNSEWRDREVVPAAMRIVLRRGGDGSRQWPALIVPLMSREK